jgi:hypothetical protein
VSTVAGSRVSVGVDDAQGGRFADGPRPSLGGPVPVMLHRVGRPEDRSDASPPHRGHAQASASRGGADRATRTEITAATTQSTAALNQATV